MYLFLGEAFYNESMTSISSKTQHYLTFELDYLWSLPGATPTPHTSHIESGLNSLIYKPFLQSLVACLYFAPFNQLLQLPPGHTSGNLVYISNFSVVERISTLSSKRQGSSIWVAHSIKFSSLILIRGRNCSLQASRDPALSPQDDKLTTQYAPLRGVAPSISRTWIGGYFDYRPGLWFYH